MPVKWRRVRPPYFNIMGILFWFISVWIGLVFDDIFKISPFLGWVIGLPFALASIVLGRLCLERAAGPLARRYWSPQPAPPPPAQSVPLCSYSREPKISYPILANARDQCGWVHLRLQVDPSGRIKRFMILDQAPGRTFEAAVVNALWRARFEPEAKSNSLRDLKSLITFVLPVDNAPDWALERLPELAPNPSPTGGEGV